MTTATAMQTNNTAMTMATSVRSSRRRCISPLYSHGQRARLRLAANAHSQLVTDRSQLHPFPVALFPEPGSLAKTRVSAKVGCNLDKTLQNPVPLLMSRLTGENAVPIVRPPLGKGMHD